MPPAVHHQSSGHRSPSRIVSHNPEYPANASTTVSSGGIKPIARSHSPDLELPRRHRPPGLQLDPAKLVR